MNNLKNMLSKTSKSDEAFEPLSIDDFFADVTKAASARASENYADTNSADWEIDASTFRLGASFALQWFADKIEAAQVESK